MWKEPLRKAEPGLRKVLMAGVAVVDRSKLLSVGLPLMMVPELSQDIERLEEELIAYGCYESEDVSKSSD